MRDSMDSIAGEESPQAGEVQGKGQGEKSENAGMNYEVILSEPGDQHVLGYADKHHREPFTPFASDKRNGSFIRTSSIGTGARFWGVSFEPDNSNSFAICIRTFLL